MFGWLFITCMYQRGDCPTVWNCALIEFSIHIPFLFLFLSSFVNISKITPSGPLGDIMLNSGLSEWSSFEVEQPKRRGTFPLLFTPESPISIYQLLIHS